MLLFSAPHTGLLGIALGVGGCQLVLIVSFQSAKMPFSVQRTENWEKMDLGSSSGLCFMVLIPLVQSGDLG